MNPEFEVYEAAWKIKAVGFDANDLLLKLAESVNIGIWQFDINDSEQLIWKQYNIPALLGYLPGQTPEDYHHFLDHLVHPDDREIVFDFFNYFLKKAGKSAIEFRLLTCTMGYKWHKCTGRAWFDDRGYLQQLIGVIYAQDDHKLQMDYLKQKLRLFTDSATILEAGGWQGDLKSGRITWTPEVYKILEAPYSFQPTLDNLTDFFHEEDRKLIKLAFKDSVQRLNPFEVDARFLNEKHYPVWVTIKGKPIADHFGKCIGLQGSIQKTGSPTKENNDLQRHMDFLADQNKRLHNFAHIVSHNLRSYSNNLQFMVSLLDDPDLEEAEKPEIFSKIRQLSEQLGTTIHDLDEIVKVNTDTSQKTAEIDLESCFKKVMRALETNITMTEAEVCYDFSQCPTITYVPAYVESIFLNLLTNSLKYRHPDRHPEISCRTYKKGSNIYLEFKDNGIGIDLKKNGKKLFGMYNTFHSNKDAKGIGLFITKNQVEALGGSIEAESTVDVGTTFSIRLT
jgi:signal transduction histidine kinase